MRFDNLKSLKKTYNSLKQILPANTVPEIEEVVDDSIDLGDQTRILSCAIMTISDNYLLIENNGKYKFIAKENKRVIYDELSLLKHDIRKVG